ncbi:hypothetical protein PC113_g22211 [Phytophthora cactorum]|uniref:Reverse transcriptase domain-containing protein n=1 Tax=Phytophthora cactorum TaxID=29920 RepID=A0A8T0Y674_9STRA|nr:hypothetical protein PC113_g22211 [Phytophthora cactorum]
MLLYISQCVDCCRGLYDGAAFTIGNAADGTTAPIRLRVGVFMGCPLSPHLFTAAIAPLLHALKRLPDTGVKLTGVDRPGAAAYADDLKTFSSSVDGVKRKHAVVVDFLRWTGMAANPSKCSTMSVQRGARGVLKTCSGRRQMPNTWERALALLRRGEHAPASVRRRGTRWSRLPRGDDAVDRRHEIQGAADGGTERWTTLKTSSSASVAAPALASTLLPVLHAAFACCWQHKTVPQSWKVGVVRLLHKKGERLDPANWRPICLQQTIYKLYAGILSRKFVRWLDVNNRHADAQKGFRAMNGCGEHNFLAATLVDHPRRKRKELHVVWGEGRLDKSQAKPRQVQWLDTQYQNKAPHVLNGAISALSTKEKKNLIDDDVEEMEECMETFDPPMELPTTLAKAEAIANMHFEPGTQSEEPTDISRHPDGTTTTNLEPQSNSYLSI